MEDNESTSRSRSDSLYDFSETPQLTDGMSRETSLFGNEWDVRLSPFTSSSRTPRFVSMKEAVGVHAILVDGFGALRAATELVGYKDSEGSSMSPILCC